MLVEPSAPTVPNAQATPVHAVAPVVDDHVPLAHKLQAAADAETALLGAHEPAGQALPRDAVAPETVLQRPPPQARHVCATAVAYDVAPGVLVEYEPGGHAEGAPMQLPEPVTDV